MSSSQPLSPQPLFYSYASNDARLRDELERDLALLRRQGVIEDWGFTEIVAGSEWDREIKNKLDSARIILLLISADFLNSEYCWGIEMSRALERHDRGDARVIPIILRDCDWQTASFAKLQALLRERSRSIDTVAEMKRGRTSSRAFVRSLWR